jgi:membrane protein required for colicin V production
MNLLDIIILSTVGICFIRGLIRGFLRELISLIIFVLSVLIANHYQSGINAHFFHILPKGRYIPLISFTFLFVISYIGLSIVAWAIKALFMEGGASGPWSRIFGSLIGTLKAVIAVYLFIILLTFFIPSKTPVIAKSKFAPVIIKSYQKIIVPISPSSFKRFKQKFMIELKRLKKNLQK